MARNKEISDKKQSRLDKREVRKASKDMIPATEQEEGGPIMKPDTKKAKKLTKAIGTPRSEKQQRKRDIKELGYDPSHPLEKAERRPARNANTQAELVKSAPVAKAIAPAIADAVADSPESKSAVNTLSDNIIDDDLFNQVTNDETQAKLNVAKGADDAIKEEEKERTAWDAALNELDANTNDDGTPRLTTGEPVEHVIDVNAIDAHRDEVLTAAAEGDPRFKALVANHRQMMANSKGNVAEPAIERLGLQDYYPTTGQNIAVGSYNRSMLGSGNIYGAAGTLMPWGVVDARRRAVAGAAADKAKQKQKLMEMVWANGAVQYQDQFDQGSMAILEKYGAATDWTWDLMADRSTGLSREFWKEITQWQTLGKQTIDVNERVDKLMETQTGTELDTVTLPPSVLKAMTDWYDGSGNVEQMAKNPKFLTKIREELKAYDDLTYKGNLIVEKVGKAKLPLMKDNWDFNDPQIAKSFDEGILKLSHGNYDERWNAMLTFVDPDRLADIIDPYMRNANLYIGESREKTREELEHYVLANLAPEIDIDHLTAMHRNWDSSTRQGHLDLKKQNKAQLWSTAMASTANPNAKSMFENAAIGPNPQGDMVSAWNSSGIEVKPRLDANGDFVNGEVRGSLEVAGVKENVSLGDMLFTDREISFDDYQAELAQKPADQLTDSEIFLIDKTGDFVLENIPVSSASVGYAYDNNGVQTNIKTTDDAGVWNNAYVNGQTSYGGSYEVDNFQPQKDGKRIPVTHYKYYDDKEKEYVTLIANSASELSMMKSNEASKGGKVVKTGYLTQKKTVNFDTPMKMKFKQSDKANVGQKNAGWGGSKAIAPTYQGGGEVGVSTETGDDTDIL